MVYDRWQLEADTFAKGRCGLKIHIVLVQSGSNYFSL